MWVSGPFLAGSYPNILTFKSNLAGSLLQNETVITDRGYKDTKCI